MTTAQVTEVILFSLELALRTGLISRWEYNEAVLHYQSAQAKGRDEGFSMGVRFERLNQVYKTQ